MLTIKLGEDEFFDEATERFIAAGGVTVDLEHSLVSLSKWESKFQKPFLSTGDKTTEELFMYVQMMVLSPGVKEEDFSRLSPSNIESINDYISSPQSATTFGRMPETKGRGEVITSELIYYWLVAFNIPFECERWHLNRLFSLIRICNLKQQKPKKMSRSDLARRNAELNAQRRARFGTSG